MTRPYRSALIPVAFPRAERVNASDAKLYAFAEIPSLDAGDVDYVCTLTVHTADPQLEHALAAQCVAAMNNAPTVARTMHDALALLDSVAFVAREGDADDIKARLRACIVALHFR